MLLALTHGLAGCALPDAQSPSLLPRPQETPRQIAVVDPGPLRLSAEEAAQLEADLARDTAALAAAERALAAAERTLAAALARARGAAWGSLPWADAQSELSRFEEVRLPVPALRLRVEASRMMVDPLAADDRLRRAVEALHTRVAALDSRSAATAEAAARALDRRG